MKPNQENFEQWNEELAEKHDLDKFYNHPNFVFRYIEQKRIRKLIDLADKRLYVAKERGRNQIEPATAFWGGIKEI